MHINHTNIFQNLIFLIFYDFFSKFDENLQVRGKSSSQIGRRVQIQIFTGKMKTTTSNSSISATRRSWGSSRRMDPSENSHTRWFSHSKMLQNHLGSPYTESYSYFTNLRMDPWDTQSHLVKSSVQPVQCFCDALPQDSRATNLVVPRPQGH